MNEASELSVRRCLLNLLCEENNQKTIEQTLRLNMQQRQQRQQHEDGKHGRREKRKKGARRRRQKKNEWDLSKNQNELNLFRR